VKEKNNSGNFYFGQSNGSDFTGTFFIATFNAQVSGSMTGLNTFGVILTLILKRGANLIKSNGAALTGAPLML